MFSLCLLPVHTVNKNLTLNFYLPAHKLLFLQGISESFPDGRMITVIFCLVNYHKNKHNPIINGLKQI